MSFGCIFNAELQLVHNPFKGKEPQFSAGTNNSALIQVTAGDDGQDKAGQG